MNQLSKRLYPAVRKSALVGIAGMVWLATGLMLVSLAVFWLYDTQNTYFIWFALAGIFAATIINRFGFLRIVDKNLLRIREIQDNYCAFGFMPWKSYFLIAIMMSFGIILRHSIMPKEYLAIIYIAIGIALMLSSIRYFRNIRKY